MPNSIELYSESFKKKQIVVWSFLLFLVFGFSILLIYVIYQFVAQPEVNYTGVSAPAPKMKSMNATSNGASVAIKEADMHEHFIYGDFSPQDNRYKIYKVYYRSAIKEEIFSFPWKYKDFSPKITAYNGDNIAIFSDVNNGFLINHMGKVAGIDKFVPPYSSFTISPNKSKMLYFKYFSSLGNTSLAWRDLNKNIDVFSWSLSDPISQICSFIGWDKDSRYSYCAFSNKDNKLTVRSIDTKTNRYTVISSATDSSDAKYYSDSSLLVSARGNQINILNKTSGDVKIVKVSDDKFINNVFLADKDGGKIIFSAAPKTNDTLSAREIYIVNSDGTELEKLIEGNANIVSVSPDYKYFLFERIETGEKQTIEHYSVAEINGKTLSELYSSTVDISDTQFLGWYEK